MQDDVLPFCIGFECDDSPLRQIPSVIGKFCYFTFDIREICMLHFFACPTTWQIDVRSFITILPNLENGMIATDSERDIEPRAVVCSNPISIGAFVISAFMRERPKTSEMMSTSKMLNIEAIP